MNVSRRRYMGEKGGSIPYQRIEYLEATDGARIRTNYVPTGVGIVINTKMCIKSYSSGTYQYWFGCGTSNAQYFRYLRENGRNDIVSATYASLNTYTISNIPFRFDVTYDISLYYDAINNNQCASVNGTVYTRTRPNTKDNVNPLFIFASSTSTTAYCNGKVYYFQVYNNGELVLDLIPVRIGTTGYMYDKVSGELFGNAGTGSFILGDDIVDIPYQRIEYLESTGTQYIDSGIKYNSSNKYNVECDLVYTVATTSQSTFTLNGWDAGGAFGISGNNCVDGSNNNILSNVIGLDLKISLEIQSGSTSNTLTSIVKGDNTYSASRPHGSLAAYAGNSSFIIFACYSQNKVKYHVKEKIHKFKMYVNDTLVRDFIPVRVGQIGYMYDTVSGELFGNAGTGDFVLGADLI